MGSKGTLAVKFREGQEFARFCLDLSQNDTAFTLGGFQTVVIAEKNFLALPERVRRLATDSATIHPVRRGGKRPPLPTPTETQELLRKLAPKPS